MSLLCLTLLTLPLGATIQVGPTRAITQRSALSQAAGSCGCSSWDSVLAFLGLALLRRRASPGRAPSTNARWWLLGVMAVVLLPALSFAQSKPSELESQLDQVAAVHGGSGPFACAGYRMARHALEVLKLEPGSFDLDVEHHSPKMVQFSCIADGAQAATKASVGKLSLRWVEATLENTQTIFVKKSTGQRLVLKPTTAFIKMFINLPYEKSRENGRKVLALPDADIFEVVSAK